MVQTSTIRSGLGRAVMTPARILRIGVFLVLLAVLPLPAGAATISIPTPTSTTSDLANGVMTVSSAPAVSQVTTGEEHSCARLNNGTVFCWGANGSGQLGDGTRIDRATPGLVTGLAGLFVDEISAGGEFTCALIGDGRVYCWGDNSNGQLGNGTTTDSLTPSPVTGLTTAIAVSAGAAHACALLLPDFETRCWGFNGNGQLGDGTTTGRTTPVTVTGLTNFNSQRSAGGAHTCAVASDGTARCWGNNEFGQLGDNTTTNSSLPVAVSGISTATVLRVASGNTHSCALRFDNTVSCWGRNADGRLGDNTTTDRSAPVPVSGLANVTQIATGDNHTCAVLTDETARCWGFNGNGRLGDGTTTERLTPVTVSGLADVTQIAAGGGHTCARLSDGTAWCWGTNASGELGDGTTTNRSTPVRVTGFDGSTQPPPNGVVGASLALACTPDALRVGTLVTCTITGGDPGVDILWRAAYNPVFAGAGLTLDQDGAGTFTFTVPRAALGRGLTVELVEWTTPLDLGIVAGPTPTSVPAGGGAPPARTATLFALLGLGAVLAIRRRAAERAVEMR